MKLDKIVIFAVKEEPFESEERYSTTVHEEEKSSAFESAHERNKQYKLKMEDTILELYEQLDNEKYGNPLLDFSQRRSLRIREVVEKLELSEKIEELESMNNQMASEIVSLKAELLTTRAELKSKSESKDRNQYNKPFSCKYCNESFDQICQVKEHFKIHHLPISEETSSKDTKNVQDCTPSQPKKRAQKSQKIQATLRDPIVSKSNQRKDTDLKREKGKKQFVCNECHATFLRLWNLQRHSIEFHVGEKPFKCSVHGCSSSFKQKSSLKAHKGAVHGDSKQFWLLL